MYQILYTLQSTQKCIRKASVGKMLRKKLDNFALDPILDQANVTLVSTSAPKFLWLVAHFENYFLFWYETGIVPKNLIPEFDHSQRSTLLMYYLILQVSLVIISPLVGKSMAKLCYHIFWKSTNQPIHEVHFMNRLLSGNQINFNNYLASLQICRVKI